MTRSKFNALSMAVLASAVAIVALTGPALADPPWRHDGPPGHRHGWKEHRGWRDRDDWHVYRHGPPPVVYSRPRVVYVPPPVIYQPQRSGISIHLPLPLDLD